MHSLAGILDLLGEFPLQHAEGIVLLDEGLARCALPFKGAA